MNDADEARMNGQDRRQGPIRLPDDAAPALPLPRVSNDPAPSGPQERAPSFASVLLKSFRRHALDQQDPFANTGRPLDEFTFSSSYEMPSGQSSLEVAEEIQRTIQAAWAKGNLARTTFETIDYKDASMGDEPPRRFMVTRTMTRRKTPVTLYAYVQPYGQHVFFSLRSYAVPSLNGWKLLAGIVILLLLFVHFLDAVAAIYFDAPLFGVVVIPAVVSIGVFVSRQFVRDIVGGDSLDIALRKQFPGAMTIGTFDDDDIVAFLKTNVALTLNTIAKVLEKHGVDTGTLRQVVQNLHVINVDTGGGGIVGAIFGGSGNNAIGQILK